MKKTITLRGPLHAWPNSQACSDLGWIREAPAPIKVWVVTKAVNYLELDCDEIVAFEALRELVDNVDLDVTLSPAGGNHRECYVDARTWERLGGGEGPGLDGERASERAMRLSAERASG